MLDDVLDELTREFDGVIARRSNLLDNQQELLNDRIENLNLLLDAKRAQLEAQFLAMEKALAVLQGQQNALGTLAQLAGSLTSYSVCKEPRRNRIGEGEAPAEPGPGPL